MAWSSQEVSEFQKQNNKMLAEINATLRPDKNLSGKVGIFIQGQAGDLMTAMSVLEYRDQIFGNKEIIWFANMPNADCLRYAPISEVRPWPWPGNGLPSDAPGDFYPILCDENNRLNKTLSKNYELTADLDDGYFPAPWQLSPQKRHGLDYPNCSRKIFGVPDDYKWHPLLNHSTEEADAAFDFIDKLPEGKRIFFETFAGSDQSKLSDEMVKNILKLCRDKWPGCVFIFASHKYLRAQEKFPENFFDQPDIFSCSEFTVRQCALISDYCNLIISVSSGITVACSRWVRVAVPIIQYCGSFVCSTKSLADGSPFELVTADNKSIDQSGQEFITAIDKLLK